MQNLPTPVWAGVFLTLITQAAYTKAELPPLSEPSTRIILDPFDLEQGFVGLKSAGHDYALGPKLQADLQLRIDCGHVEDISQGAAQPCAQITRARLHLSQAWTPETLAEVAIDPFEQASYRSETLGILRATGQARTAGLAQGAGAYLQNARLHWALQPGLQISLGQLRAMQVFRPASGLATAALLWPSIEDQLGLKLQFALGKEHGYVFQLLAGNGEGEWSENLDPQSYLGLQFHARFGYGAYLNFGLGQDGNTFGTQRLSDLNDQLNRCLGDENFSSDPAQTGHSVQHLSLAFGLDGTQAWSSGWKLGIGMRQSMRRQKALLPTSSLTSASLAGCSNLDPEAALLISAPDSQDTQTETTFWLGTSYAIMNTLFVGLDWGTSNFSSDTLEPFLACTTSGQSRCLQTAEASRSLSTQTWGVGLTAEWHPALRWSIEYQQSSYDRVYAGFHFPQSDGTLSARRRQFLARLDYRWDQNR